MLSPNVIVKKSKLYGLQVARGIAAMLVVLFHASNHLKLDVGYLPMGGIFHFGRSGVDFFFVLSGFIIFHVHAKDIGHTHRLRNYLSKRLTRIYPIYWIIMLILLGISFATHKPIPMSSFFADASLLPMADLKTLGVAWTLRYEMFFYAIFALAIISRPLGAVIFSVWLTGISLNVLGLLPPLSSDWMYTMVSMWNVEFMLGILGAFYLSRFRIMWPKTLFSFSILGFITLGILENINLLDGRMDIARLPYGIMSMLILIALVEWERLGKLRTPSILVLIGEASYSIYLIHLLMISLFYKALSYTGLIQVLHVDVIFVFLFIGALAGGIAVSRTLEMPAISLTRSMWIFFKHRIFIRQKTV